MRLYVNTKEVPFLKAALRNQLVQSESFEEEERLTELLKRVELCEELQESERRAKNKEAVNET